jgi:hypothetical protein
VRGLGFLLLAFGFFFVAACSLRDLARYEEGVVDASPDTGFTDANGVVDAGTRFALRGVSNEGPVTGNTNLAPPPGTAEGDFLLLAVAGGGQQAEVMGPPSGWTSKLMLENPNASCTVIDVLVAYKFAEANELPVVAQVVGSSTHDALLAAYTGVNRATPIDLDSFIVFAGPPYTTPDLRTHGANELVVALFFLRSANGGQWSAVSPGLQLAGSTARIGLFDGEQPVPGPFGMRTVSTTAQASCGIAHAMALRPP